MYLPVEHWLLSVRDLWWVRGLSTDSNPWIGAVIWWLSVPFEPCELVLLDDKLDTDIIDWGLLLLLHNSVVTGPTIEFLNLGAAKIEKYKVKHVFNKKTLATYRKLWCYVRNKQRN